MYNKKKGLIPHFFSILKTNINARKPIFIYKHFKHIISILKLLYYENIIYGYTTVKHNNCIYYKIHPKMFFLYNNSNFFQLKIFDRAQQPIFIKYSSLKQQYKLFRQNKQLLILQTKFGLITNRMAILLHVGGKLLVSIKY